MNDAGIIRMIQPSLHELTGSARDYDPLIELIGDWVVRELVFQATAWRELGIGLEIGFNLSPRQFWQPDLASRILARIRDSIFLAN